MSSQKGEYQQSKFVIVTDTARAAVESTFSRLADHILKRQQVDDSASSSVANDLDSISCFSRRGVSRIFGAM